MKTIGLLTSGGDSPGMNACVAAIAGKAEAMGVMVRGVFRGFRGLAEADSIPVGAELAGLARRGGSFLGTSHNGAVIDALGRIETAEVMKRCDIEGLIVLGGGKSLEAASTLASAGIPLVGVPCTIDNDIYGTDYCLGFDSAVNKALRAADEIMDTAESLSERVFVIETLGGTAGHIALATAYSAGADAVFVHEAEPDVDAAASKIRAKMDSGGSHGLVVVCENLGTSEIMSKLESGTGRRVRLTVLGHILRGGNPTCLDRVRAREFGELALDLLLSGSTGTMTAYTGGCISSVSLFEVASKLRSFDIGKYQSVNAM